MHKRITTLILIVLTLQLGLATASAYSSDLGLYYPMNGTSGSVIDYSGNNNDGSISGSITRGASICNTDAACSFPSDGGYISTPDSSDVELTGDWTISFWVKPGASGKTGKPGLIPEIPAQGCEQLQSYVSDTPSGNYWIDPNLDGDAAEVYCDMSQDGGGWMAFRFPHGKEGYRYSDWNKNGNGDWNSLEYDNGGTVIDYENYNTGGSYTQSQLDEFRQYFTDLSSTTHMYSTSSDDDGCDNRHSMRLESYKGDITYTKRYYDSTSDTFIEAGFTDDNFYDSRNRDTKCDSDSVWYSGGIGQDNGEFWLPYKLYDANSRSGGGVAWGFDGEGKILLKNNNPSYRGNTKGIYKRDSYSLGVSQTHISLILNGGPPTNSYGGVHNIEELSSEWNHVTITRDDSANTITYYVNGDQKAQDSFSGSINTNGNNLEIGDLNWDLSDLRFYDSVVPPDKFAQNYSNMRTDGDQDNGLRANLVNQTGEDDKGADVWAEKAGTDQLVCPNLNYNKTDVNGNVLFPPLDQTVIYDLFFQSNEYQNEFQFRNIRVPDEIEAGLNQNFVPESTMSNSIKFSAGHTLPAQTMITRPFSDFDVVNVSIEKNLNDSYRLVSDVLVRKYNVNFEGQWQDWSNRKTVTVQEIYNRDWSDSTGEMNDAWGIIEFNPEGFQNNDCSDVRLTDTNNNVQDFTVNTCQDDYVQLEFNAPIDALEAKDFYVYYGNSEASDAQTSVERLSETEDFQMDNGITDTEGGFWFQSAGQKNFNMSIPQNVEFLNRDINIEGNNQDPQDNQLSSSIDDDYQEYSGIEFTPKRPTVIEGMDLEMASTTVDSEIAIRNMSSGSIIHTRSIPDNGPGSYYINFTDETVSEGSGDNIIYRPGDNFRVIVRNGQARRDTGTVTSSPMYEFPDFTVDNQVYSCSSDGSSCSTGDYPTLVSSIETISLLPDLTITYDNEDTVLYDEAQHLNTGTIDLSSVLQSEEWREGDPLDDPRVHEFTVDSADEGNITLESYSSFEFEHPVESVTKNAAACSVNPQSSTYFYIDKTDCPYLDRINVTQGQWFRLDYRFRVPGPSDFDNTGDINSYNVSDTMVRYNTLAETEEFTSG